MDRQGSHNQPCSGRSSSSVNSHPESHLLRIDVAKNLIERCMRMYMTKNQVSDTLFTVAKIERRYSELVWEQLERENADFFKAYHTSLILKDQIITFNKLLRQQQLLTEHLRRQQQQLQTEHLSQQPVQQSPPGLTTGNPAIQNTPIPFSSADHGNVFTEQMNSIQNTQIPIPSADHGNVFTEQMNSGNGMERNANVATNSKFLHLPSDLSRGFDSASKSHFERIPQSLRFGIDDKPKSSTGVVMSDPTVIWSNLPDYLPTGIHAIQQPPIPFPSADHGNFLAMQMNPGNEMVWNENVASNSQFLHLPSDMSSGFDSATKSDFERIPQSLRFGMDGEPKSSIGVLMSDPKSSTGVVMSHPTSDWSNLPVNLGNSENKRRKKDE